ncbi:hypothetical protein [Inediibacterium massiliense]|nr:hypothetical protein [Inediibacterium massiliense]
MTNILRELLVLDFIGGIGNILIIRMKIGIDKDKYWNEEYKEASEQISIW